jgi:phage tail sheath protein FI
MPEYLSPGVYVEETSFRSKSIEGVSTSTAGFVGPARFGPVTIEPELITSLGEFERAYGDGRKLDLGGAPRDNHLWHGVRAFYAEGGKRLYVARVFRRLGGPRGETGDPQTYVGPDADDGATSPGQRADGAYFDGHARAWIDDQSPFVRADALGVRARYPGAGGNVTVRVALRAGQNAVVRRPDGTTSLQNVLVGDLLVVLPTSGDVGPSPYDRFYVAERDGAGAWVLRGRVDARATFTGLHAHVVTAAVSVRLPGGAEEVWEGLALQPGHVRDGLEDSLTARFGYDEARPTVHRELPIVINARGSMHSGGGAVIAEAILRYGGGFEAGLAELRAAGAVVQAKDYLDVLATRGACQVVLEGGNDGAPPGAVEYEGVAPADAAYKTGLKHFEDRDDVSIVAAPGSSHSANTEDGAQGVAQALIAHAELMRYRIAVLDSINGHSLSQVRAYRARLDSKHAAFYYPWVKVLDPITRQANYLPPSGFVAGIYARNDVERAVYKAPANEVVRLAQGFELTLNRAQQDVLNPEGINCFRFFEGRGNRLWGARTISSDPEWKYVNLRRYFAYLEHSIDKGTQWAVFEPNGERLWANVRRTIEDFLINEFQNGALLGERADRAFFVKCDRSTMTQNDLDNGRLVCLIGVAPLRPAEFVVFRIGQWTGDRRA